MNYGQFLQMMPEVILVLTLIVVFLCDMFTKDTEKRSLVVVATFGPWSTSCVTSCLSIRSIMVRYPHLEECISTMRPPQPSRLS